MRIISGGETILDKSMSLPTYTEDHPIELFIVLCPRPYIFKKLTEETPERRKHFVSFHTSSEKLHYQGKFPPPQKKGVKKRVCKG